jgi:Transglutaminase-like superfamily
LTTPALAGETRSTVRTPFRSRLVALVAPLLFAACATSSAWTPPATRDTRDDPASTRPGYGNADLHTWWPLTAPEVAALQGLDRAKQGDAHALLRLGLLSSGDHRDAASYAAFEHRVDQFVADVRPTIEGAGDDWHRGYELHRAMHRVFFDGERTELGRYDFNQARLTGVFTKGRYNCLSSAVLFVVLARAFELPVRAVVVPTHVFVEMGTPGGKLIEIETTSATGFDWIHDARFFRDDAVGWSSNRGLRPVTLDDYEHRRIIEPYRLMALAMRDGRSGDGDVDRMRLHELAAVVDADDVETQRDRLQVYGNESVDLYKADAWRTMVHLYDVVGTVVAGTAARSQDSQTLQLVAWARWEDANALMIVGRTDEAMALMSEGLAHLDPTWSDAETLRNNYLAILVDRLNDLIAKKDSVTAIQVFTLHRDACRAHKICAGNAAIIYENSSIDSQNAGDWQSARQSLQDCARALPDDPGCRDALSDLESRHRF